MSQQSDKLNKLAQVVTLLGTAPTLETMPRRTLADKGIAGPTAAHFIEEVHVPYNFACMTFSTGTTAFQNVIGVTYEELAGRIEASREAFTRAGVQGGDHALVTYAPLLNVYTPQALKEYGMTWEFLHRSSRDALLLALCREQPKVIIGESSFLRVALEDAANLGLASLLPKNAIVLCSGTALDLDLLPAAERFGWEVHDLYGCQEFGWLVMDGIPLRSDISLIPSPIGDHYRELVVGGLPMADSFLVDDSGHLCNRQGKILTYRRERTHPEYEVYVKAATFADADTMQRIARSILRIKGRVVKVDFDCVYNAPATWLELVPGLRRERDAEGLGTILEGPEATRLFDTLSLSVLKVKETGKSDPTWTKKE